MIAGSSFVITSAACSGERVLSHQEAHYTLSRYTYARLLMGTRCTITLYAESEKAGSEAAMEAFNEIAQIEHVLTDYNENSESMRLMRQEPGRWHSISPILSEAIRHSNQFYLISSGAFDPTLGACTHLWRKTTRSGRLPTQSERDQALMSSGFDKLELDSSQNRLKFTIRGMILDFGGIGKGFAADKALNVLASHGVTHAMVNLGGDIRLGDPPPDQPDGWSVEIQSGHGEQRTESLARCAVATSGDAEQYFDWNGERYSHILNPKTGLGVTHPISVTVIAPDSTTADALASVVSVLGSDYSRVIDPIPDSITVSIVRHHGEQIDLP